MIKRIADQITRLRAVYADPRTPWYCRWLLWAALAYALSPVDLIPDFIPVLGYLDDLVILPLLIALAWWLLPAKVKRAHRQTDAGGAATANRQNGTVRAPPRSDGTGPSR